MLRKVDGIFPTLKREAFKQFEYWDPDTVIVEAKASGLPLTDELRQSGIPCGQLLTWQRTR